MDVGIEAHLARQSGVRPEIALGRKDRLFSLAHRANFTGNNLNAACRAAGVSAASVQDIDPVIFNTKNKFPAITAFELNGSCRGFGSNFRHQFAISLDRLFGMWIISNLSQIRCQSKQVAAADSIDVSPYVSINSLYLAV
jgi:hypothetical protein